jgi:hypothetical protein
MADERDDLAAANFESSAPGYRRWIRDSSRTRIGALALIPISIGIFFGYFALNAEDDRISAAGTVIEIHQGSYQASEGGGYWNVDTTIEYEVGDITFTFRSRYGDPRTLIGENVEVFYNPESPVEATTSQVTTDLGVLLLAGAVFISAGALLVYWKVRYG